MITVNFDGETIVLDKYQQLAVLYLKMEPILSSSNEVSHDEAQLLELLNDLQDATQLATQQQHEDLQPLVNYLDFQKRKHWQYLQELRDTVSLELYRNLHENAHCMMQLIQDNDDPERLLAAAHSIRFRALYCQQLARHYFEENKEFRKALALLQHCETLTESALEEMAACQDDEDDNNQLERYITQLEQLLITIQASRVRVQATL